jgi:hypothetical protein
MKRLLYFVIVAGVCGYSGYLYWTAHPDEVAAWLGRFTGGNANSAQDSATAESPVVPKRLAPPGILYMVERVSKTTKEGVSAVEPGEEVRLMERKKNGTLVVTTGKADFTVQASQVTNDLDQARQVRQATRSISPP